MTDQPEYTDIVFTRHRGKGITVDTAPPRTRIALQAFADRYAYLHMPTPDTIVFADQVVYRVTGYADGALELELIEDWRTKTEDKTMPTCTATIQGPHVLDGGPIACTREAGHPENHVGPNPDGDGRTLWTDHTAGATPHQTSSDEQP